MIASTGKILAAIGIANAGRDRPDTLYLDRDAPASGGLDTCAKGGGEAARAGAAIVAFACSLNTAARVARDATRPGAHAPADRPASASTCRRRARPSEATPPSTAAVRGLIAGSPRRVHQMAGVVLASLTEQGHRPVRPPTLVKAYDFTSREAAAAAGAWRSDSIVPNRLIARSRPAAAEDAAAGAAVLHERRACSTAP